LNQLDEWRAQERELEEEPDWTDTVCKDFLKLPHWDDQVQELVNLDQSEDPRASKAFAKKNILI
jgi:3-methyladenine DNA glycosylase AlkD